MTTMPRSDEELTTTPRCPAPGHPRRGVVGTRHAAAAGALAFAALLAGCAGSSVDQTLRSVGGAQPIDGPASSLTTEPAPTSVPSASPATSAPGLPTGWQELAVAAANSALTTCAQATSLTPAGCPQQVGALAGSVRAVEWRLLDGALSHAVAVPSRQIGEGSTPSPTAHVAVYGRYAMDASFIVSGQGIRPYRAYSGGLTAASMTWDGASFQNVRFASTDLEQSLPVSVQPFRRPAAATDAAARAAVKAGFGDCVTIEAPATDPAIPNCPQFGVRTDRTAISGRWVLKGDPTSNTLVSFNPESGDVAVTGSFDMNFDYTTPPEGPDHLTSWSVDVSGRYTAVLSWDGNALNLVTIVRA